MSLRHRTLIALAVCGSIQACGKQETAPPPDTTAVAQTAPTPTNVATIDSVRCAINKSNPPELVVMAYGTVPTGGWTNEKMDPRVYVTPPVDGIWDYDFMALKPTGPVPQVITPIQATHTWADYPANDLKGVRIHGVGAGIKESTLQACNKA
jgi:hypothetical protein